MNCKKVCYFSELKKNINVCLTAFVGALLGLILFVLDKFNVPGLALERFAIAERFRPMVITLCYGALISVIALVVLILLVKAFSKRVNKEDGLLVGFDTFALTILVSGLTGLDEGAQKSTFVIVVACLALVLTVLRFIFVKEASEEMPVNTVEYRVAFAKRFNLPVLLATATLVGVGLGVTMYCIDFDAVLGQILPFWLEVTKFEKIGYVAGIGAAVAIGFNLYTIMGNRGLKFGWLVGFLLLGTIVSFFAGLAFVIDIDRPAWHFHAWGFIVAIFALSMLVRSLFVNCNIEARDYGKSSVYANKVLSKYSVVAVLAVSLALTGLLINIDVVGLGNIFASENIVATILAILLIVALGVVGLVSLIRNGLKAEKAAKYDFVLLVGLVTGGMMLFDLYYHPTLVKLVLWLVFFVASVVLALVRMSLMKEAAEEVVEEVVEETPAEEPVEEVAPVVELVNVEEHELVEETVSRKVAKHYYANKLKFVRYKVKGFYSQIKNYLLSLGVKATVTRRNEVFRKSGVVCKLSVSGRTLRIHLPLDPNDETLYPITKYHQFDLSDKKRYAEVGFTMKIRSAVACKRVLELLEKICSEKGLKVKNSYEQYDFVKDLDIDGTAIFDKAGCLDMLVDKCDLSYADKFNGEDTASLEKVVSLIPSVEEFKDGLNHNDGKEAVVTVEEVLPKLNGEAITLESLKVNGLIEKDVERLVVRVNDSLTQPVAILCDEIDEVSALVVLATGGKIAYYSKEESLLENYIDSDSDDEDDSEGGEEVVQEEGLVIKAKRTTFVNKIKFTSDKVKEFYSALKNKLLSYGCKNRLTRRNEQFRKSGLVAKISVSGKTIKLHLPLNPLDEEKFPNTKYHQVDLSNKKQYSEVPFTVKVKSDRGLNRALGLIEEVCSNKELKVKRNYQEVNFAEDLVVDGSAVFEKLGCSDRLVEAFNEEYLESFKAECSEAYERLYEFLPSVNKEGSSEGEVQNVYIDTVLPKLEGDVISLETLKEANIISKSTNNICVKIHDNLDRKITVICDEIAPDAALAVLALGGKVLLSK